MSSLFVGFCYAVLLATAGESPQTLLTANEHPWGNFPKNSWCIVQTLTISNIDGRTVQSSQTVKTVLENIDENSVTLHKTETVKLGGKSVERIPLTTKCDFFQERIQENVHVSHGPPAKLQMTDQKVVLCSIRIYSQQTSDGHLTTTIWYTSQVYPYIFRIEKTLRSSLSGDGTEGQIIRQSVTLVQETSALKKLRGNRRNRTYTLQTIEKTGNITKITDARCSWDVPGGLLGSTTREFDAQNKEIRRSESRMSNMYVPVLP